MEFADKLIELRRQKGWSQETLADYLGVSRQAVSKWEAGRAMPDIPKLIAAADLFGVSLDELLRGKAAPAPADAPIAMGPLVAASSFFRYEYVSKTKVFGIPLVCVRLQRYGGPPAVARGIIAVGNIAVGAVAVGGVAVGLLAFGGVALGLLFALAGVALGGVAFGGAAIGVLAMGGVGVGVWAMGGAAIGSQFAFGGVASATVAVGGQASGQFAFTVGGGGSPPQDFLNIVQANAPHTPGFLVRLAHSAILRGFV